jgi:chromosome partitioning protein
MRRIAVINQKGGVGKTTTTANLGAALARAGRRVLLIDLDPQAHLSLHFGMETSDDQPSMYDVLTSTMPIAQVAVPAGENVTLVPSDIDLAGVEAELISVMGREVVLREAVEAADGDHDVMLIDCPPSLGVLTVNALAAADELIIPLQAQFFALQGLSKLLDTVTLVRRRINPMLRVDGIALCIHEPTTRLAGEVVDDLRSFLESARGTPVPWADARVYETYIRRNIKLAEASSFGQTIFDYAPRSNGARDYARLAAEIFADMGVGEAEPKEPAAMADDGVPAATVGDTAGEPPRLEVATPAAPSPGSDPAAPCAPPPPPRETSVAEPRPDTVTASA